MAVVTGRACASTSVAGVGSGACAGVPSVGSGASACGASAGVAGAGVGAVIAGGARGPVGLVGLLLLVGLCAWDVAGQLLTFKMGAMFQKLPMVN